MCKIHSVVIDGNFNCFVCASIVFLLPNYSFYFARLILACNIEVVIAIMNHFSLGFVYFFNFILLLDYSFEQFFMVEYC